MSKETGQERYDRISELLASMHPERESNQITLECASEIWENVQEAIENGAPVNDNTLLNGAQTWSGYVVDGKGLVWDEDIAKRLRVPYDADRAPHYAWKYSNYLRAGARLLYSLD